MSRAIHISTAAEQFVTGAFNGNIDCTGDYSVTPASFRTNISSEWECHRVIVQIQDSGTFDADLYGNGVELTNGIRIYHKDASGTILEELTAFPILSNGDWEGHCFDYNYLDIGNGDNVGAVRWTFQKHGKPIFIDDGEYMEIYLNDNFSGLSKHRYTFEGVYTKSQV